uniref:Tyrosinase copper-binding domain-containing protein n=1 Tax=Globisporangium ultimum (strain ATCC 200006 / CBS 805.95 / DAOM BR144) TaxID=431595 RepID=K3WJW4_GLOUD
MLPQEKEVYLRAIQLSMDNGLYIKFVEIHTEQMTTAEAHRTCMFVYWHRLFLLGFENMLRSYGGEFSCITVPYWNYVDHNDLFLSGACSSMEDCAPILRELGGSQAGRTRTVEINGTPIQGTCVTNYPANHFCQSSVVRGNQCARCIPRGDWATAAFPPTTSVSSLMRQLFSSPTIASVATNLEQGIHNTIHNSLEGAMSNLEAPADPIFFSHHATIDLLHTIFYKCAVGNTVTMSLEAKLSDPRQFTQCARRTPLGRSVDRNVLLPQSSVMIRSGGQTEQAQSVFEVQNPLDPFFAPLPQEYLSLSDVRDIGEFSYNYEITGLLGSMYTTCGGLTTTRTGARGINRELASKEINQNSFVEAVVVPSETSSGWYNEALAAAVNATSLTESSQDTAFTDALAEVEKMTCVFYDECRGKVRDYNAQFRQSFHTNGSTPCSKTIAAISSGQDRIKVRDWRAIFLRHLECDHA